MKKIFTLSCAATIAKYVIIALILKKLLSEQNKTHNSHTKV